MRFAAASAAQDLERPDRHERQAQPEPATTVRARPRPRCSETDLTFDNGPGPVRTSPPATNDSVPPSPGRKGTGAPPGNARPATRPAPRSWPRATASHPSPQRSVVPHGGVRTVTGSERALESRLLDGGSAAKRTPQPATTHRLPHPPHPPLRRWPLRRRGGQPAPPVGPVSRSARVQLAVVDQVGAQPALAIAVLEGRGTACQVALLHAQFEAEAGAVQAGVGGGQL